MYGNLTVTYRRLWKVIESYGRSQRIQTSNLNARPSHPCPSGKVWESKALRFNLLALNLFDLGRGLKMPQTKLNKTERKGRGVEKPNADTQALMKTISERPFSFAYAIRPAPIRAIPRLTAVNRGKPRLTAPKFFTRPEIAEFEHNCQSIISNSQ
jgi:hypothetical protein